MAEWYSPGEAGVRFAVRGDGTRVLVVVLEVVRV